MATASLPFACVSTSFVCQWTLTPSNYHLRLSHSVDSAGESLCTSAPHGFLQASDGFIIIITPPNLLPACYSNLNAIIPSVGGPLRCYQLEMGMIWHSKLLSASQHPLACRRTLNVPSCILTLMRRSDLLFYIHSILLRWHAGTALLAHVVPPRRPRIVASRILIDQSFFSIQQVRGGLASPFY